MLHRSESTGSASVRLAVAIVHHALLIGVMLPVPSRASEPVNYVCLDSDRRAWALESLADTRPLAVQRQFVTRGGQELSHCWAWTRSCAPQRVAPDEDFGPACASTAHSSLAILLALPESLVEDEASQAFAVSAAPAAMWRDVPRSLLPTFVASGLAIKVPRTVEPWRIHAVGTDTATAWADVSAEQVSVALTLQPAVEHEFLVTADAMPLPGARLSVVRPSRRGMQYPTELLAFEAADPEGRIRLVLPVTAQPPSIVASVSRAAQAFPRLSEIPATVELGLGLVVSGQTVNSADEPIPGARLSGASWVPNGFGLMQRHETKTGPDGRFALTGFASSDASLSISTGALEYSKRFALTGSVDLGRVVLLPPERIWIRVVDHGTAKPVRGANVQITGGAWDMTNAAGVVEVRPTVGRTLLIQKDGYLVSQLELPRGAGAKADGPFEVRIQASFTVHGVYVSADGRSPATGGRATAYRDGAGAGQSRFGLIRQDGTFSLDLEAGTHSLELVAGNAGRRRIQVTGSAGERRDLGIVAAPLSAWVSGHVVSPEYVPVHEASVYHVQPSETGALMAWAMGEYTTATTDSDGYFQLHGLEPGTTTLRIEASGFAPMEARVEAMATEWVDAGTLQLSRGRRVLVRSNVDVGLVNLDPGGTGNRRNQMQAALRDGRAAIETVPEGAFRVRVFEEGVLVCQRDVENGDGDETLRCDRNLRRVSGRVTIDGLPADGSLLWRQVVPDELPGGVLHTLGSPLPRTQIVGGPAQEHQATLDADGYYELDHVMPGRWEVIWASIGSGSQEVREVTVPSGPSAEVTHDFEYAGVSISGTVTTSDGEPAFPATIDIFPQQSPVVTDRDGRFQILGLEPSVYQVRARLHELRSRVETVGLRNVGDRESVHLILDRSPANEELRIDTRAGDGFCFVEMWQGSSKVKRLESGQALVKIEPPLAETVRIACIADGRWILTGWQKLEAALDRGVQLDPTESTSTITLLGDSDTAVEIVGPGGWDLGRLRRWLGSPATFRSGETLSNLPIGEYVLSLRNRVRTVWTEHRRVTEVHLGGF